MSMVDSEFRSDRSELEFWLGHEFMSTEEWLRRLNRRERRALMFRRRPSVTWSGWR